MDYARTRGLEIAAPGTTAGSPVGQIRFAPLRHAPPEAAT